MPVNELNSLTVAQVEMALEAAGPEEAIRQMSAGLRDAALLSDVESFIGAVLQRESEASTFLGRGAALPHARMAGATQLGLSFGRSSRGVPWGSKGERVQFIFLTVVPLSASAAYLALVRNVARALRSSETRHDLLTASDGATLQSTLLRLLTQP
jgi:mannitol/fructose-specific phosphotransferase system IIA component (Ntr-type)